MWQKPKVLKRKTFQSEFYKTLNENLDAGDALQENEDDPKKGRQIRENPVRLTHPNRAEKMQESQLM